ncbi:endonuclease/exonuclease/phosphatase family protein [Roseibium denhamense]|uniref:Uncharacterized conserved protein YafD, endonuclease/exonuclease/phosphatase (EEP) superfamily n=1 Tax=Roseibium denhamense TaxID=76305 RepID=A0ABY1NEU3_9HYPH|nr:endonuclease/exonuclease/phosphatase family protein [Roseibium denhamense]MTI04149.1 endonuclease/exonuclease/phosphatase family protein [Roseibium denhamense]SMP07930.1 Uncharacterized conserved protein YafD, endonuclease/exonuclease/phosphatase (EEP) superfamily [Roseibium denhamense]
MPRSLPVTLFSLFCWCCCLGAIAAAGLGLSAFAAPDFWLTDNMSFFLRQFLGAGAFGCVMGLSGLFLRHRLSKLYKFTVAIAITGMVVLAGLTLVRTTENTVSLAQSPDHGNQIRVVSINIENLFLGDTVLQAYLSAVNADVIVFQETLWWLQERRWERLGLPVGGAGSGGFPGNYHVGQLGGLVVYSRFPITGIRPITIDGETPPGANVYYDADRELISLTLETPSKAVKLVAIHPDSPRTKSRWQNKRRYFDATDDLIRDLRSANELPLLAIGDWNSAPWSARFQRSLSDNNLKTAYPGGWPQTTRFFFDYRLHWILGAPVDQFAVTEGLEVLGVSLGPDIGSDHLPLVVDLAVRN